MRRVVPTAIIPILAAIASCTGVSARPTVTTSATQPQQTVPERSTDSVLRAELLRMGAEDQAGREQIPTLVARGDTAAMFRFMRADSARTRRLKEIIAARGWPTRASVGKDGLQAAWLVLQHSPDYGWQEELLPVLEKAAAAGEILRASVAQLTDRILVHQGKPQRYGNSFSVKDGRLVADPIDDLPGLDARRAAVGLPPMAGYVRGLGEVYNIPVEWPPHS